MHYTKTPGFPGVVCHWNMLAPVSLLNHVDRVFNHIIILVALIH